jgi:hypothetical protein
LYNFIIFIILKFKISGSGTVSLRSGQVRASGRAKDHQLVPGDNLFIWVVLGFREKACLILFQNIKDVRTN